MNETLLDIAGTSSNVFNISDFEQLDGERAFFYPMLQAVRPDEEDLYPTLLPP